LRDASKSDVKSMLQHFVFTILVPVNPDGYVYSWEVNRMWRKTRSDRKEFLCNGAVAGVDANRNWGPTFGQTASQYYDTNQKFKESLWSISIQFWWSLRCFGGKHLARWTRFLICSILNLGDALARSLLRSFYRPGGILRTRNQGRRYWVIHFGNFGRIDLNVFRDPCALKDGFRLESDLV